MRCPRCRNENPAGATFCEECGGRLDSACPRCGEPTRPGDRFCGQCGQPLAAVTAEAPKYASPALYTPKHLADLIVTSRRALEGERKQITVLFADLKGSMELLADRDPEEAGRLLDPVIQRMMAAVHRYEGTVNQVMGDGIMALFGAPVAHEDHAVRAAYAALEMQAAIRRYAEELRSRDAVDVHIRVGLNSGEVVVGAIGTDLRMEYTAVGRTTHLAARMEQLAIPGSILLTADTLRLVEDYVVVKPLGPVPVKGLDRPIEVYELTGATALRSRFHIAAARGLSRFVGRRSELEQIHEALARTADGRGRVVAIAGEPGVGKSRLMWEAASAHRTRGWLVLEAGAVSYEHATPYRPVIDLLRAYFQIESRDDVDKIRDKVTGKLLSVHDADPVSEEAILGLLDVPIDDPQWRALDPTDRRRRTLDAVARVFLHESRVQPVLLVIEDLHWIDSETQAVLDLLVVSVPTTRLAVLVNYRPEYEHRWGDQSFYVHLHLDALSRDTVAELVDALLGTHPSVRGLRGLLIERTEGNPFFVEESVRTLAETGVLADKRGAYRLAKPIDAIQVPATVQAVLAARFDRQRPEDKRLLQEAAVIGREVSSALLQGVSRLPADELARRLARLQSAEFLYESQQFPEPEYTFTHALTHEVAYEGLLQNRRRLLHGRVVEALEGLGPDRSRRAVEQLAHHTFRGELWEKAVTYARAAGTKAATRGARQEAVLYFRQALTALEHVPQTRENLEQAIDVRFSLGAAYVVLADFEHASECLHRAEALAEGLNDRRRFGRVAALMTQCSWLTGELQRAVDSGRRALAVAEDLRDFPLQVRTMLFLGWTCHLKGDYASAMDLLRRTIDALPGDLSRALMGNQVLPAVGARSCLAWSLAEQGAFEEALAIAEQATELAESVEPGNPFNPNLVFARFGAAMPYLHRGDLSRAIALLERALDVCQRAEVWFVFPLVAAHLARGYALAGRGAEARRLLDRAAERSAAEVKVALPLWTAWLAECHLVEGRIDQAADLAHHALERCRLHAEVGHEAWIRRLLGEIASRGEAADVTLAESHYREALAMADSLGMRPLVAHCHFGLGGMHGRRGHRAAAMEHLEIATAMYRDMKMEFWLAKATALNV